MELTGVRFFQFTASYEADQLLRMWAMVLGSFNSQPHTRLTFFHLKRVHFFHFQFTASYEADLLPSVWPLIKKDFQFTASYEADHRLHRTSDNCYPFNSQPHTRLTRIYTTCRKTAISFNSQPHTRLTLLRTVSRIWYRDFQFTASYEADHETQTHPE